MMRIVVFLAVLAVSGCSDGRSVVSVVYDVSYDAPEDYRVQRPPALELTRTPSGMVCAADFVSSVETRFQTNANDLEFWCRDPERPFSLEWERLPKPHYGLTQAHIANYKGRLIELSSYQVWNEESATWAPLPSVFAEFADGSTYFWQRLGADQVLHLKWGRCDNAYLLDAGGTSYGTLPASTSYAMTFDTRIAVMAGGDIGLADFPATTDHECDPLETSTIASGAGNSYGGALYNGRFWIGGSGGYNGNGSLYSLTPVGAVGVYIEDDPTTEWEYYAYSYLDDQLIIGLYPSGGHLLISPDLTAAYTEQFAPVLDSDWTSDALPRYREAQAVVSSYGALFTGLYPWGEVVVSDFLSETNSRTRLLQHPARSASKRLPYIDETGALATRVIAGEIEASEENKAESAWAQRIPTVAILSGKICASTATMNGVSYNPALHASIMAEHHAKNYGAVYCARLPGHVMFSGDLVGAHTLRFTSNEHGVSIAVDSKVVASQARQ
jgi:hypothetical protein